MPRPKGARDSDYDEKRAALLRRMTPRVLSLDEPRPSLRQLAEAAEVTVPTLRHYFGARDEAVEAVLADYRARADDRLQRVAEPTGPLETSIRDYADSLVAALREPREVRLSDVFAVSLAEGLLNHHLGPAALRHIVDPSVEALQARLEVHRARGEMREADTRAAALMLVCPLLIAVLHQDRMGGCEISPADLPALTDELVGAFLRAYSVP